MRDTIFAVLVMAGLATSYHFFRGVDSVSPSAATSASARPAKGAGAVPISRNRNKGVIHDESTSRVALETASADGADAGSADDADAASGFASIYEDERLGSGSAQNAVNADTKKTSSKRNKKSARVAGKQERTKAKVVLGVPLDAFVRSQQNRLAGKPVAPTSEGMRTFFNCMELKSEGAEPLTEQQCKSLAFREIPVARGGRIR